MVEGLIVGGNALDDLHGVLNGGLVDDHRLEPPLQGGVLFDILPVLHQGGGADDLELAPGEGRFEDVGGVHGSLGVPGAHQVMDFVNH